MALKKFQTIDCADCGKTIVKRGAQHKYCPVCSEVRHKATKARHQSRVKDTDKYKQRTAEYGKKRRKEKKTALTAAGLENSLPPRSLSQVDFNEKPPFSKYALFKIPFSYAISKNHVWSTTRKGHVYMRDEHRRYRESIIEIIKANASPFEWVQGKIWIDIFVQKPDAKGDAINVVDGVCDAVKKAIGIDDRWFSIRRLDWEICKDNPQLIIGIGQVEEEPVQVCSYCGNVKALSAFRKRTHAAIGVGRECKSCLSLARKKMPGEAA